MSDPTQPPVLDRQGLEVLSGEECWRLLGSTPVGRLAFVDEGVPMILPITFRLNGHSVVFRTASGAKLHAAVLASPVAFEVDGWDASKRSGWSVVLQGVAEPVRERDELVELEKLGLRPWADVVDRDHWIRIRPDEVSGRRIV